MGKGGYLGGSTIVRGGKGFTELPEGGEPIKGPVKLTPNQVAARKRSNRLKARRTKKVKLGLKANWMD